MALPFISQSSSFMRVTSENFKEVEKQTKSHVQGIDYFLNAVNSRSAASQESAWSKDLRKLIGWRGTHKEQLVKLLPFSHVLPCVPNNLHEKLVEAFISYSISLSSLCIASLMS
ncbi:hypothetical protein Q8A73_005084 [Channa argus]|nr:hypothetical protein Q8A73_005084 [Channa argus]